VPRDVFPSLHVGLSALLLVYSWRANKIFALITLPFVVGNWLATVYLRYHYTIDIAASIVLVPLVHYAVQLWMRRFPLYDGKKEEPLPQTEVSPSPSSS